jgi:flagellar biosynthetic protein FliR
MQIDEALNFIPTFVLVFFRLAGLMIFAPLLGSARIPRRVKAALALALAMCLCTSVRQPVQVPQTGAQLAAGIGGEMVFGVAMGMVASFVFIAVQWGGEMIGQQMGLNLSEVFDPQFGASGSLVGEMYFMLTTVVFLFVGGHLDMIRASFDALPLLSLGVDQNLFELLLKLLESATQFALQLAAPVLVTMLVVDLALGCISKTMPQMNVMTAGLTLRSIVGMVVLIVSIGSASGVIRSQVVSSINQMVHGWTTPAAQ